MYLFDHVICLQIWNHRICLLVIIMIVSDRHGDLFIYLLLIVGHHGNLQETESPMSYYPSMRHVSSCHSYKTQ